jgi:N-acetylneuraminic acid mutarotase
MKLIAILKIAFIFVPVVATSQSQNWTRLDDFDGLGRSGAFSFSINGKGYVGSGINSSGEKLNDFWEYDPITDTWAQVQDASGIPRAFAVGFAIGNKGYMGTGAIGAPGSFTAVNDFYVYDPVTNDWDLRQSIGLFGRRNASAFVIGNKGYVTLGFSENANPTYDETMLFMI